MKLNDKILNGYENTKLVHFKDLKSFPNAVKFEDVGKEAITGVLKACWRVDGELMQIYTEQENHVAVIAATRQGKTTSHVIPTVLSFAKQKVKRSMVITDPKGEIYRYTAATLRNNGYRIKLLNFRDFTKSECWNPLTPIYRKHKRAKNLADEVELVLVDGEYKNKFNGKIYDSQTELDYDIETRQTLLFDSVEADVDNIARMLIDTVATSDPTWEDGSRDFLKGLIFAMLEDTDLPENPITEDTFSLNTIFGIVDNFKNTESGYDDCGYFSNRDKESKSYGLVKNIILDTASGTRSSYMSVFVTKLSEFKEITTRTITSCNSFDMEELVDGGPIAIFIDFRDEIKSQYQTIALFVQSTYKFLIETANQKESGKLDVPWYFILDEFGNFCEMRDFETTISACAGRNIWFILIIQSYAQLSNVYGAARAEIIKDNLNVHVFFGSNNPDTLAEFSRECGQYTRISPLSAINGSGADIDNYQIETLPLIPKSMLAHFNPGECIITEVNCGYVMFSKLERFYLCEEFNSLPVSSEKDYVCNINPLDKRYRYKMTKTKKKSRWEF